MASDLLTFDEYLDLTGKAPGDVDDEDATQIAWDIGVASAAIRAYADRDFTLAADTTPGPRDFLVEEQGFIEIDDCSSITSVAIKQTQWTTGRTLDTTEWIGGPFGKPILHYVQIFAGVRAMSPAMGFTYNLDNPLRPIGFGPAIITVTADWGWPEIPDDVKQAVVWTVQMAHENDPGTYASEAIEGYSRSRGTGRMLAAQPAAAIPVEAQAILDPYTRINV